MNRTTKVITILSALYLFMIPSIFSSFITASVLAKEEHSFRNFIWIREEKFESGGQTRKIQIYRHNKFAEALGLEDYESDPACEFALIPRSKFIIGSPASEAGRTLREGPQHEVWVNPFLISRTEITQKIWEKLGTTSMEKQKELWGNTTDIPFREGPDYPMYAVNWQESADFCDALGLRLPTEAEFEFACRAGVQGPFCFGENREDFSDYGWSCINSGDKNNPTDFELGMPMQSWLIEHGYGVHPVGRKKPNAFGLFDVHGNVAEWCQDSYYPGSVKETSGYFEDTQATDTDPFSDDFLDEDPLSFETIDYSDIIKKDPFDDTPPEIYEGRHNYLVEQAEFNYSGAPDDGSAHEVPGDHRIIRGGSYMDSLDVCRSASRSQIKWSSRYPTVGFRAVYSVPEFDPYSPQLVDKPPQPRIYYTNILDRGCGRFTVPTPPIYDPGLIEYRGDYRTILLVGKDLLYDPLWTENIRSDSEGISYKILDSASRDDRPEQDGKYTKAWNTALLSVIEPLGGRYLAGLISEDVYKEHIDLIYSLDWILLFADIDDGTPGGVKTFEIGGRKHSWLLRNAARSARIEFVREIAGPDIAVPGDDGNQNIGVERINAVYSREKVRVQIYLSSPLQDNSGMNIVVSQFNPSQDTSETLILTASPILGNPSILRTELFLLNPFKTKDSASAESPEIYARANAELSAVIAQTPDVSVMNSASAMVYSSPDRVKALFLDGLTRAALVHDKNIPDVRSATAEKVGELTNFVVFEMGNRKVRLTLGDHAAMLMLRDHFLDRMTRYTEVLNELFPSENDDFALLRFGDSIRFMLPDTSFEFGDIEVARPTDNMIQIGMPLRQALDETWLYKTFSSGEDIENFKLRSLRQAIRTVKGAAERSLLHAKEVKDDDLEGLLRLTGVGFETIANDLVKNMMTLETSGNPPQLGWKVDRIGRSYVKNVYQLAEQYEADADYSEAATDTALAIAMSVVIGPEMILKNVLSLTFSVIAAVDVGANKVPEYLRRKREIEFAIGARNVLGEKRLIAAELRKIPEWKLALDVIGTFVGIGADVHSLATCVKLSRATNMARSIVPKIETSGLSSFAAMTQDEQSALLAFASDAKLLQKSGGKATELQNRAITLVEELAEHARLAGCQSKPANAAAELIITSPRTGYKTQLLDMPKEFDDFEAVMVGIPKKFSLGKFKGRGTFASVYALLDRPGEVIKFIQNYWNDTFSRTAAETIENAVRVQELLGDIPQLKITDYVTDTAKPYLIQEALSGETKFFKYNWEEVDVFYCGNFAGKERKIVGIEGGRLEPELQRALLRLAKKFPERNLVALDFHMENIYFFKKEGAWHAGILDQDFIAEYDKINQYSGELAMLKKVQGNPGGSRGGAIASMRDFKPPKNFDDIAYERSIFPDADYFMEKMLEREGRFFKFVRDSSLPNGGRFESDILDMEIVMEDEFFPNLYDHIDPDWSQITR